MGIGKLGEDVGLAAPVFKKDNNFLLGKVECVGCAGADEFHEIGITRPGLDFLRLDKHHKTDIKEHLHGPIKSSWIKVERDIRKIMTDVIKGETRVFLDTGFRTPGMIRNLLTQIGHIDACILIAEFFPHEHAGKERGGGLFDPDTIILTKRIDGKKDAINVGWINVSELSLHLDNHLAFDRCGILH